MIFALGALFVFWVVVGQIYKLVCEVLGLGAIYLKCKKAGQIIYTNYLKIKSFKKNLKFIIQKVAKF